MRYDKLQQRCMVSASSWQVVYYIMYNVWEIYWAPDYVCFLFNLYLPNSVFNPATARYRHLDTAPTVTAETQRLSELGIGQAINEDEGSQRNPLIVIT